MAGMDRSEHRRTRAAQALFEGAFDAAPVGMAMVDATRENRGTLQRVNPALAALVGKTQAELVGRHSLELLHADDREAAGAARAPAPDQPIRTVPRVRRGDGSYAPTEITTTLVRGTDGEVDYLLAVVVDPSAGRLAEDRLRASEERFRTMVESSGEGVWVLDAADRLAFSNPRMAEMLGDVAEGLIGAPAAQLVVEEDVPTLALALKACRAGGRDRRELRLSRAGSGALPVIVSLSPLRSREGHYEGALATVTDISALVAAERERELRHSRLHDRQRLEGIGRLAGGIAHEFNNLLGVILNYAAFLDSELADRPEQLDDLGQIRTAAERAAGLTRQLLTFSRQDLAAPQPVDLSDVVHHAEDLLKPALEAGVDLSIDVAAGPCVVRADRRQIEQVLLNLAINAGEAMPGGGELTIELEPNPPWVVLRVRDTGVGMAADVVARAFEPFFSTKADAQGVGLGLASVYGIVAESQGHVGLESQEGAGTTVTIRLPVLEVAARPGGATVAPLPAGAVLLVDDEPAVRELAARLLRRAGFSVIVCEDPVAALARPELDDGSVQVLLTDLVLPHMTGDQLAALVLERLPAAAVVFMSGYAEADSARDAVRDASVVFVQKPFTADELVDGVRCALARAGGAEPEHVGDE